MKYLLLGAGLQGTAIAHDLLRQAPDTTALCAVDSDADSLERLGARFGDPRLRCCPGYVQEPEAYEIYPYTSGTTRSSKAADAHPVVQYCLPVEAVDYVRDLAKRQARSMSAVIAEGVELVREKHGEGR